MTTPAPPDGPAEPARKRKPKAAAADGKAKPTKARATKPPAPTGPIALRWDLAELPSSQHKAGLAGLALCVEALGRSPDRKGVCECDVDPSGLTLRVDRDGMQALFDEVYAAHQEEQERAAKLQGVEPIDVRVRDVVDDKGVTKQKTFYVYAPTTPTGRLIAEWDQPADDGKQLWLKLWRDLVWSVLRGIPAQRGPYDARVAREPIQDGAEEWDALAGDPTARVELPSTYYLGAQAQSAENVSFRDILRLRFLLHFWPFVVAIYVPAVVGRDGERDFEGFALAIPDVTDLDAFVHAWRQLARERSPAASGYRPREAIVDLAAEAGLDVSWRVFDLLQRQAGAARTRPFLAAVDVFHVEKEGNNIRMRGIARVDPRRDRVDAYGRIRGKYQSRLFRRQRLLNILDHGPDIAWSRGFGRLCSTQPVELTIEDKKFRNDCRIAFTEVEMTDTESTEGRSLEELVYRIVQSYVRGHLESKYDLKWKDVADKADEAAAYSEWKNKLAREAFLGVRSRTGADFVAYFTGTLCSVHLRVGQQGYLRLAQALHDPNEVERLRSLTLLALAAV